MVEPKLAITLGVPIVAIVLGAVAYGRLSEKADATAIRMAAIEAHLAAEPSKMDAWGLRAEALRNEQTALKARSDVMFEHIMDALTEIRRNTRPERGLER